MHRFAATSSALLSTLPGVDFPEQAAVAAIESPAACGPASSPPRLPRGGGVRGRRMLVLVGVIGIALLGGGAWAFWSAGSAPGASAQGVAASVDQVTGLGLGGGGVTPTADPDVALAWNAASLSNGHGIDGYVVRRYLGSTPTAVCGSVATTHCTDAAVPDGTYTYGVSAAFDSWTGPESARLAVTVDTSAPVIIGAPHSPSANGAPSFTFSDATYSHFRCRLDGAASFTPCTSPDDLTGLADGPHIFRVEAVDANGIPTQVATHTWTIDTSPPALTGTPSDPSANTTPSLSFTHGSYGSFDCSVDGSGPAPCSSPDPLSALGNGSHTFQVEAIDADGVTTPAASYTWTVDASAPSFTARPTSPSANPSPSFSFSHTQTAYTFRCNLDGAGYSGCSSPASFGTLADGSHELDIEAVGADGVATAPAVYDWTIDTSPPTITPTTAMVAGGTYASQSASFTLGHPSYSSFECFLDGGSFAACGGGAAAGLWPSSYQATPTYCASFGQDANNFCFIHDSSVELGVKFTAASPVDVVGVRIYRVDAGDVTASLWSSDGTRLAGPTSFGGSATHGWQDVMFGTPVPMAAGQTYTASYHAPSGDYPFQWFFFTSSPWTVGPITALQSAGGDLNGVYCYGGASCFPTDSYQDTNYWVTPLWTDASGGSATYSSLPDGVHTITATALDGDGHTTNNATFSWTVEHAAPMITNHPDALTSSTSAAFAFAESPYSHFACALDGGSFIACDGGTASYSGLGDGVHTFTVHAVDSLGATTADQTFTWTVDATPPTVDVEQASGQSDPASSQPLDFTATFDEPVHSFTGGVTLGGTANVTGATATVTQTTPTTYDISVSGVTGSGTVTVSVDAGATADLAGNTNTASTSTDNSVSLP